MALGRLPHGADLSRPTNTRDSEAVQRALHRVDGLRLAAQRLEDKLSEVEELQQRLDQLVKGHEV